MTIITEGTLSLSGVATSRLSHTNENPTQFAEHLCAAEGHRLLGVGVGHRPSSPNTRHDQHLILLRTAEGRVRAKAHGVKFGRKLKLTPYQQARARIAQGEALTAVTRSFGVGHITISRLAGVAVMQ